MAEYISKDDAKLIIDVLDSKAYSLSDAKKYISIKDRLKAYMNDSDSVQREIKK